MREADSINQLLSTIRDPNFVMGDTWQAQIQTLISQKADVYVYSDGLDNETIANVMLHPCESIEVTVTELLQKYGPGAKVCVLPERSANNPIYCIIGVQDSACKMQNSSCKRKERMAENSTAFPYFKRENLVEMVFDALKQNILNGSFKNGERLPTQEELCQQFGVSRTVMIGAFHKLSSLKLIESQQGRGTFVRMPDSNLVLEPIVNALLLDKPTTRELIETRYYLERSIVRLAAKHIDVQQVEELQHIVHEMDRNFQDGNIEAFSQGDLAFHMKLAEMSQNSILKRLIGVIREMLATFLDEFNRTPGAAERANEHHRKICAAIVEHDADGAEREMQLHLQDVMEILHAQYKLDVDI